MMLCFKKPSKNTKDHCFVVKNHGEAWSTIILFQRTMKKCEAPSLCCEDLDEMFGWKSDGVNLQWQFSCKHLITSKNTLTYNKIIGYGNKSIGVNSKFANWSANKNTIECKQIRKGRSWGGDKIGHNGNNREFRTLHQRYGNWEHIKMLSIISCKQT
jgi:hypothetical protein